MILWLILGYLLYVKGMGEFGEMVQKRTDQYLDEVAEDDTKGGEN